MPWEHSSINHFCYWEVKGEGRLVNLAFEMTTNWHVTASFSTDLAPTPVWLRILYFCTSNSKFICYFTSPPFFYLFCVMNRWTSVSKGLSLHLQILLMLLVFKATSQQLSSTLSLMAVFWSRKVSQALGHAPQCLFCAASRSVLLQCHPTAFWEIGEILSYPWKKKAPPSNIYTGFSCGSMDILL